MRKIILICLLATGSFILSGNVSEAREKLRICGTGDSQELLRVLAIAFQREYPNAEIEVPDSTDSSGGIRAVARGECDLGRVARSFREKERRYHLNDKVFAYSPLAFVVNPSVKRPDSLTSEQVLDIYSGKITHWSQVGGEKSKIYVVNREKGDSSRECLEKNFLGFKEIENHIAYVTYSVGETVEAIAGHRNTLGYVPLNAAQNAGLTVLKVDGIYPSEENIRSGAYPLITPLGLVWKNSLEGLAKDFFDFLFTPEAQEMMLQLGAIP